MIRPSGRRVWVYFDRGERPAIWTRTIERGKRSGSCEVWTQEYSDGRWVWRKRLALPDHVRPMAATGEDR